LTHSTASKSLREKAEKEASCPGSTPCGCSCAARHLSWPYHGLFCCGGSRTLALPHSLRRGKADTGRATGAVELPLMPCACVCVCVKECVCARVCVYVRAIASGEMPWGGSARLHSHPTHKRAQSSASTHGQAALMPNPAHPDPQK
jgi:hypothetical protein